MHVLFNTCLSLEVVVDVLQVNVQHLKLFIVATLRLGTAHRLQLVHFAAYVLKFVWQSYLPVDCLLLQLVCLIDLNHLLEAYLQLINDLIVRLLCLALVLMLGFYWDLVLDDEDVGRVVDSGSFD